MRQDRKSKEASSDEYQVQLRVESIAEAVIPAKDAKAAAQRFMDQLFKAGVNELDPKSIVVWRRARQDEIHPLYDSGYRVPGAP